MFLAIMLSRRYICLSCYDYLYFLGKPDIWFVMFTVFRVCYRKSINPIGRSTQRSHFATQPPDVWLQSSSEGQWCLMLRMYITAIPTNWWIFCVSWLLWMCWKHLQGLFSNSSPEFWNYICNFCFKTCNYMVFIQILVYINYIIHLHVPVLRSIIWSIHLSGYYHLSYKWIESAAYHMNVFRSSYEKGFAYYMHIKWSACCQGCLMTLRFDSETFTKFPYPFP